MPDLERRINDISILFPRDTFQIELKGAKLTSGAACAPRAAIFRRIIFPDSFVRENAEKCNARARPQI